RWATSAPPSARASWASFLSFCETGAGGGWCDNRRMPMPTVAIDVPSAQVLADQASIISELQFVMDCCKRLLAELDKPEEERDPLMPLALWSSAVLAYGRCFSKGTRFPL